MSARIIPKFDNHERFFKFIKANPNESPCWKWQGSLTKNGYGKFGIAEKGWFLAHRVSFSIFKNDLNLNMMIDHICRDRSCVNPDHLREVGAKINTTENSSSVAFFNKIKTHCIRGHEFTQENSLKIKRGKACRICTNSANRKRAKKFRKDRGPILKKYCTNGHPWIDENVKINGSKKQCKICREISIKKYNQGKRNKKLQIK